MSRNPSTRNSPKNLINDKKSGHSTERNYNRSQTVNFTTIIKSNFHENNSNNKLQRQNSNSNNDLNSESFSSKVIISLQKL